MGPIIEAIDAGHVIDSTNGECRAGCGPWSTCEALAQARTDQVAYAARLKDEQDRKNYQATIVR